MSENSQTAVKLPEFFSVRDFTEWQVNTFMMFLWFFWDFAPKSFHKATNHCRDDMMGWHQYRAKGQTVKRPARKIPASSLAAEVTCFITPDHWLLVVTALCSLPADWAELKLWANRGQPGGGSQVKLQQELHSSAALVTSKSSIWHKKKCSMLLKVTTAATALIMSERHTVIPVKASLTPMLLLC